MSMTNEEASNILRLLATESLEGVSRFVKSKDFLDGYKQAYEMAIKELERKKGKWIPHPEVKNIYGGIYIECSECHTKYVVQHLEDEKFCRNCGADMRKGEANE